MARERVCITFEELLKRGVIGFRFLLEFRNRCNAATISRNLKMLTNDMADFVIDKEFQGEFGQHLCKRHSRLIVWEEQARVAIGVRNIFE